MSKRHPHESTVKEVQTLRFCFNSYLVFFLIMSSQLILQEYLAMLLIFYVFINPFGLWYLYNTKRSINNNVNIELFIL